MLSRIGSALAFLLFAAVANAALTDGLLVRLKLDEGAGTSAADQAGNYTCTLDAASWVNDATRGDVYLSSATNFIDCGSVSVPVGPDMTIAFWMLKEGEPNPLNFVVTKYAAVTDGRSFRVAIQDDNDTWVQVSVDGAGNEIQQVTDNVPDAAWVHVIVTFDSGVFNGYYDNTLQADDGDFVATDIFDSATNSPFCIGHVNCGGGGQGFVGRLSEVAIWDRVLTAQERTDVFNDNWEPASNLLLLRRRR